MITDADFKALEKPLRKLWEFLDGLTASNAASKRGRR
jgi:hypothetical protein